MITQHETLTRRRYRQLSYRWEEIERLVGSGGKLSDFPETPETVDEDYRKVVVQLSIAEDKLKELRRKCGK